MEYNAEFFTTKTILSVDSPYKYEIQGPFYTVYSNGEGDYHMAIEDKASLLERFRFYELYISKEKYPIYTKKLGLMIDSVMTTEIFRQCLGLPLECMIRKDKKGNTPLTFDEILYNIHFEENLKNPSFRLPDNPIRVLEENHPSVIGAINYLIENGFYVLEPECIFNVLSLDDGLIYPIYIDPEKIPAELLLEEETSDKLLMDFCSAPLEVDKDVFLTYYKPLDQLSLQEKFVKAFGKKNKEYNGAELEAILCLRRYFLALIKRLLNDYYRKMFSIRGLFGFTVLDQDYETFFLQNRFVYLGARFNMYALESRFFEKIDNEVVQKVQPTHFVFDSQDKKGIIYSYKAVKKYIQKHPNCAKLPSLFMKLMGLPYPAFQQAKYFDFEEGDGEDFASLFEYIQGVNYRKIGLLLPVLDLYGGQYSLRNMNEMDAISFYVKAKEGKDLYFQEAFSFITPSFPDFICDCEVTNKEFYPIFNGDISYYRSAVELIEQQAIITNSTLPYLPQLKSLLLTNEENGVLLCVHDIFSLMMEGYTCNEALKEVCSKMDIIPPVLRILINCAIVSTFDGKAQAELKKIQRNEKEHLMSQVDSGEIFFDPYLPLPYVVKGRNFIGYKETVDGPIYFDEKDRENIEYLMGLFFDAYSAEAFSEDRIHFFMPLFGREMIFEGKVEQEGGHLAHFIGVPTEGDSMTISNRLVVDEDIFKKNISLLDREDHRTLLQKDPSLSYYLVMRKAFEKKIYLMGKSNNSRPLYYNAFSTNDPRFSIPLSDIAIKVQMFKEEEKKLKRDSVQIGELCGYSSQTFHEVCAMDQEFVDLNEDGQAFHNFALGYVGEYESAVYQTLYEEAFRIKDKSAFVSYFTTEYEGNKLYVAPGERFYAFSKSGKKFYFMNADQEALLLAINGFMQSCSLSYEGNKSKALRLIAHIGVPQVMYEAIYNLVYKKKEITLKELKDAIPFTEDEYDMKAFPTFRSQFCLEKNIFSAVFFSSQLTNLTARNGLFLFLNSKLLIPSLLSYQELSQDVRKAHQKIMTNLVYIHEPKEEVKAFVQASEGVYSYYVDQFIDLYTGTAISPEVLFFVREALLYEYHKDKDFVISSINAIQSYRYSDYLKKTLKDFSLPEMNQFLDKERLMDYIALFVLFLEQQALIRMTKRIVRKS